MTTYKLYYFIIIYLTFLIGTYYGKRIKRVVGGKPLEDGQYPFFALLILPDESFTAYLCGGSLINPKWILTSADCFPSTIDGINRIERLSLSNVYTVYMGSFKINNTNSIYTNSIEKIHIHPGFYKNNNWNISNNIALAQLRWEYNLTKLVNVVYLPSPNNAIKRCDIGKVISIGPTSWHDKIKKNSINVVLIRVKKTFKEIKYFSPTMFYSQALLGTRHALEDDVGAPFVCYPDPDYEFEVIQYGVVAGAMNTSKGTMITFIEDVEKYMGFIKKHVQDLKYYLKIYDENGLQSFRRKSKSGIEISSDKSNNVAAKEIAGDEVRLVFSNFFAILYWFIIVYLE